jgi:hypothetical protein
MKNLFLGLARKLLISGHPMAVVLKLLHEPLRAMQSVSGNLPKKTCICGLLCTPVVFQWKFLLVLLS